MENENIVQDNEILNPSDTILDSPLDNEVTGEVEGEEVLGEEMAEEFNEEELSNETDITSAEEMQQIQIDYTENLIAIDEHLQLVSARIEYCNCLLIIILLIVLLRYVYKFLRCSFRAERSLAWK